MSAVGVAPTLAVVIVFGEKERSEGAGGSVPVKKPVDGAQEEFGMREARAHWLRRLACRFAIGRAAAM